MLILVKKDQVTSDDEAGTITVSDEQSRSERQMLS